MHDSPNDPQIRRADVWSSAGARELSAIRGADVAVGSVYAALDRLELKGLITSSLGDPSPERGGRAKRYFRVTEQGLNSVRETRKTLTKLWKSLPATGGDIARLLQVTIACPSLLTAYLRQCTPRKGNAPLEAIPEAC